MQSIDSSYLKSSISIPSSQDILSSACLDSLYHAAMEKEFDIASWVREARISAELSQEALGEKLGKTKGNISAWEKGRHEPSFKQVIQISAITGHLLPAGIVVKAAKTPAANDADQLDPDELIEVIRGFKVARPDERSAILQLSRRALRRVLKDSGGGAAPSGD